MARIRKRITLRESLVLATEMGCSIEHLPEIEELHVGHTLLNQRIERVYLHAPFPSPTLLDFLKKLNVMRPSR